MEFKTGVGSGPVQNTAVAFSNAQGGVILVGVEDDGAIVGRTLDAGTADAIHTALGEVHDPGRYGVSTIDVGGKAVTVISVARREQGFAQTSSGRVLQRRGTQDRPLFGSDLQRFISERATRRFEATPTLVTVEGCDPSAMAVLRSAYSWATAGSDPTAIEGIGLALNGRLTVAGALHLLTDPTSVVSKAYVEIFRYPDDGARDYDRREEVRGPLHAQVEGATRSVMDHLGTELVVLGVRRFDLPRLPEVVVREAIANAVAHRSYEATGTAVRVELRPGTVTITSPGSLPEPVTLSNMREANAARNVDVIRVLRRLGLAEDAGRGVDVMQDTMRSEMLEQPAFDATDRSVTVQLPIRSAVAPVERAWIRELEARGDLAPGDRLILVHAARGETLTNGLVRRIAQVDSDDARKILRRLRDQGLVRQRGQRGAATYVLADSLRPPAGLRLDADELDELVAGMAQEGPITNLDVRRITGLDRAEALAVLNRLVLGDRLVRIGARRGTRYQLPGLPTRPT